MASSALVRSAARATVSASTKVLRQPHQEQRRGFLDYLTKYPDTIMETKRKQMAGGVNLGIDNPTWLKQGTGDRITVGIALTLLTTGMIQLVTCYYRLASGKGKRS